MASKIKKDDIVKVITGKYKNIVGKVLRVIEKRGNIFLLVEGVNKRRISNKRNRGVPSIEKEGFIHISNVKYYSDEDGASRIGFKFVAVDGVLRKVRFLKSSNKIVVG